MFLAMTNFIYCIESKAKIQVIFGKFLDFYVTQRIKFIKRETNWVAKQKMEKTFNLLKFNNNICQSFVAVGVHLLVYCGREWD